MKRVVIAALLIFVLMPNVFSQVFNTGGTLKKGTFSVGLEPVYMANDFGFFLHGGYGIRPGLDLGVKAGLGIGNTYFGADIEWGIGKNSSFSVGGHMHGNFGIDGTLLFTIPVTGDTRIYGGLDADIVFPENNDLLFPLWVPIGLEVDVKRDLAIIIEGEIPITNEAYSVFGGGVVFYF